ncbi:MAG: tyrosine-type recombinase/integrase [Ardenticatenia bacterium]|nr:tyrosine-type recombinase/integrase [Ardenticatenia bacterium]
MSTRAQASSALDLHAFEAARERFLRFLRTARQPHTVATYAQALSSVTRFLDEQDVSQLEDWTEALIEWAVWLREARGVSKATLATYLSAVRQFAATASAEGWLSVDLPRLRERYRLFTPSTRRLPNPATEKEFHAMLQAVDRLHPGDLRRAQRLRLRNRAILHTLWSTGVRVSELVRLTYGDLLLPQHAARVVGKGDKERLVFFSQEAWKALWAYLQVRERSLRADDRLFVRHDKRGDGKPLSTRSVEILFSNLCKAAGLARRITPHQFRHAFGTRAAEVTGGNLPVVQTLMGHASPNTTMGYVQVSNVAIEEARRRLGYAQEEPSRG